MDRERTCKGPINKWKRFKKMSDHNFIPRNFNARMRVEMYHLKQGSMSVIEFKAKFEGRVACFPLWREADKLSLLKH